MIRSRVLNGQTALFQERTAGLARILRTFWLHRELFWILIILAVAGVVHSINMLGFPFFNDDEGIYVSQAWAVATEGRLAAYTYFYDHAPAGWILIALWSSITGGFHTFGTAVASGRELMLVLQLGSTLLLYRIARIISKSVLVASAAALLFALSPLAIEFHRRVLLDNIAAFWMLLSFWLLLADKLSLKRVWLSAIALGVAILSKELVVFVVPVLAYLTFHRAHASYRWMATVGWTLIVGSIVSWWILMATLRGELFPAGSALGGTNPHVSLLETLIWQASRGKDGGLLQAGSQFWREFGVWVAHEPFLVVGGGSCALLSVVLIRRHRVIGISGLLTLALAAFLGRGGVIYGFYLAPLLPLLALNVSLVVGLALRLVARLASKWPASRAWRGALSTVTVAAVCSLGPFLGYNAPGGSADSLWNNHETAAQGQAVSWLRQYVQPSSAVMVDSAMWTDLHDADFGEPYQRVHYYFKMGLDPEIRDAVFDNDWRNVDWAITTPPMGSDVLGIGMELPRGVIDHSTVVAHFDTGGWPQDIRRVDNVGRVPAETDQLLAAYWQDYKQRFIRQGRVMNSGLAGTTTSEAQAYALLQSVYMDDHKAFDEVWRWSQGALQAARRDGLLAWQWDGAATAAPVRDRNSATDADQDAALALLFASRRWHDPIYETQALAILNGIWESETREVAGKRIPLAGPWSIDGLLPINPSYVAPYAYRIFAEADPAHPWQDLLDGSYSLLRQLAKAPNLGGSLGVVPDWVLINPTTGELSSAAGVLSNGDRSSLDGGRLQWRLALDWLWFSDPRARNILDSFNRPSVDAGGSGRIAATYGLDGAVSKDDGSTAVYAWAVPALLVGGDAQTAYRLFAEKVLARTVGTEQPSAGVTYYDANWAWFTSALMDGGFSNLWAGQRIINWSATATGVTN